MACHRKPGENWRFIEIDPEVIKIARDPKLFRFLSECGESAGIVAGDGRIALAKEPANKFDVIILDAFSSDSIPVHLMTEEALALYFDKLKPGGAIVFHISNRFMELASVVAAVANTQGAKTFVSVRNEKLWKEDISALKTMPVVAVVSRNEARFEQFKSDNRWYRFAESKMSKPWSDDFSNLLGAIYRGYNDDKLTRAKRH
jgi:spermidine synthase